ncbi:MAG: DUF2493 domain-containing protein [Clostridia bacterium]|nr:DUF2493 domain-containing protein [Clostridia bacterium]
MKVAVIGSRSIEYDKLQMRAYELLCEYIPANCTEIVSGGAMGVDRLAEIYARKNNIPIKVFLPDYDTYGKRAPKVRNEQIVEYADEVIAFWDTTSTGTAHTVATAVMKGVTVHVVRIQKDAEF